MLNIEQLISNIEGRYPIGFYILSVFMNKKRQSDLSGRSRRRSLKRNHPSKFLRFNIRYSTIRCSNKMYFHTNTEL